MTATLAPATISNFYLGADIGQVNDYTALAILEHVWALGSVSNPLKQHEMRYNIVHLERVPLGTSYPDQVALIKKRYDAVPLREGCSKTLLVDATGVGRAVVDLMRANGLYPIPIVITGGAGVTEHHNARHVPKRDLVSAVQVLMQTGRFKVAGGLPEGRILAGELQTFKYKMTSAANVQYEAWRESDKDDMVLAVAICAWIAHRYSKGAEA